MGLKELKETANEKMAELGSWIDEHPESYITGVMAVAGLASVVLFVADKNRRKHSKNACADNYAQFGDLIVHDVDVADFVEKHLKGADKKDIYKIVSATLWTHGIMEGFGGDEPIPEGKWYFFKDV